MFPSRQMAREPTKWPWRSLICFKPVEIDQEERKLAAGALRALDFAFEHVQQGAVIAKAGERIAGGQTADLIEKSGVVEKVPPSTTA